MSELSYNDSARSAIIPIGIAFLVLCIPACLMHASEAQGDREKFVKDFAHPRELQKLTSERNVNSKDAHISGYFVLGFGGISGESKERNVMTVDMAYKDDNGLFSIVSIPMNKIKVRFDESTSSPTVELNLIRLTGFGSYGCDEGTVWDYKNQYSKDSNLFLERYMAFAVITVKESMWQKEINMPLSGR